MEYFSIKEENLYTVIRNLITISKVLDNQDLDYLTEDFSKSFPLVDDCFILGEEELYQWFKRVEASRIDEALFDLTKKGILDVGYGDNDFVFKLAKDK